VLQEGDGMYDVTALGEILVDFTPAGDSPRGNRLFERNAGGAPANVLVCLAKLGDSTAFLGKVGDDAPGRFLVETLKAHRVDVGGLRVDPTVPTTLAFVELDAEGGRTFEFRRDPGADTALAPADVDAARIADSRIFHFGSLSLTHEPARSATLLALSEARKHGLTVSYDPNLRPALWRDLDEARTQISSVLKYADVLKLSGDELAFLTGQDDPELASLALQERHGVPLVLVTLGRDGCLWRLRRAMGRQPAFSGLPVVDTTGAGDAFLGAFLHAMVARDWTRVSELDAGELPRMARFACAVAGLCTTRHGAIPAMPTPDEVAKLLSRSAG
jgi:sugar/nucleoside kinase (ribokinase family)